MYAVAAIVFDFFTAASTRVMPHALLVQRWLMLWLRCRRRTTLLTT
jgi:hypothetical protein